MAAAEKARTQLAASYQAARARPPLDLFLHQLAEKPGENEAEGGYERRLSLSAAVAGSGGGQAGPVQGLGPLRFLVRENGVPVSAYTAREVSPPDVLAVAFLLPCNTQLGDPPGRAALAEAARIHRRTDVWSVLRYRDGFRPPPDELAPALRFAGDPSSWVSGAHGYRGTAAPGLAAAVESIVPLLGVQRGTRHLIAVAGLDPVQEAPDPALLGELRGHLAANRIAFHAVVPASAPLGVLLAWQPLCRATGGWCAPNVAPDGIAAAVRRIAVAVLHRYDLAWTSGHAQPALSIEVLAPHGYGKLEFGNI
jgi:hypothetical protein